MRRLLCFGDSNTYGYDPRSYAGGRYPSSVRWTDGIGPEYEVINAGRNGRTVPRGPAEWAEIKDLFRRAGPVDLFLVMLGTNDLLNDTPAEETADRMDRFLEAVLPCVGDTRVLLIAPPPLEPGAWVPGPEVIAQSERYAALCGALARERGLDFADAGAWKVGLAFDGVHFSEEGHRAFVGGLRAVLRSILNTDG